MSEEDLFIPIKIPIHTHILINWYYINFLYTCIPVLAICQVIDLKTKKILVYLKVQYFKA